MTHLQHLRSFIVSFILRASITQADQLAFLAAGTIHHLNTITP